MTLARRLHDWWRDDPRQDHRHAARVAVGLAVPGLVLLVVGRPELLMYAAFGSFAGMYGRLEAKGERFRHQFHGAGMLVTGVALGVVLARTDAPAGVLVGCVTAFAVVGSLVTDRLGVRPGGPFFGIFALGATATSAGNLVAPAAAVVVCVATASLSIGLGLLAGGGPVGSGQRVGTASVPQAARYAVATLGAGLAGLELGIDHANWAMAAAAVPLAVVSPGEPLDIGAVVHRAGLRLTGTLAGLVLTALLLLPDLGTVVLALAVMLLLFPTELFMSRRYGLALGFFTPLIMCMTELADPSDPLSMLLARGADTAIGVVAGVAAARLVPDRRPRPARAMEDAWAA